MYHAVSARVLEVGGLRLLVVFNLVVSTIQTEHIHES